MGTEQITSEPALKQRHAHTEQAAVPQVVGPADSAPSQGIRKLFPDAMEVFIAWERLRLLYNAILIVVALVRLRSPAGFLLAPFLLEPAVYANVCFCAGPVAEGYLCLLGVNRRLARWTVFTIGTLIAAAATWILLMDFVKRFDK